MFGEGREATHLLCVLDFCKSPCLGLPDYLCVILTLHLCVFFSLRLSSCLRLSILSALSPSACLSLPPSTSGCFLLFVCMCVFLFLSAFMSPVSLQLCYLQGFANLCVCLSV